MKKGELVSINVGKPKQATFQNRELSTGIFKKPVDEPIFLSRLNFDGDAQADLVHHGGVDKAVCVYPFEHYGYWENELRQTLPIAAFGENLTTRGLLETDVCVGDVFQLGEAIVQVSQPRQPCYKLSMRYGDSNLPLKVQQTGYTGYYLRVLEEGVVAPTDRFILVEKHPKGITVAFANEIMHRDKNNAQAILQILEVEELSANWRKRFINRLDGKEGDATERLTGKK